MKNIDDGPDGLNEAAFERALGGGRKSKARARKPVAKAAKPWSGMCLAGKHGLDFEGQDCDVCRHDLGGPCEANCRRCCAAARKSDLPDLRTSLLVRQAQAQGGPVTAPREVTAETPQSPDTKSGFYYVSAMDDRRVALVRGPFVNDHAGAIAMVDSVRAEMEQLDPRAAFYAFGTVRCDRDSGPGFLNARAKAVR